MTSGTKSDFVVDLIVAGTLEWVLAAAEAGGVDSSTIAMVATGAGDLINGRPARQLRVMRESMLSPSIFPFLVLDGRES